MQTATELNPSQFVRRTDTEVPALELPCCFPAVLPGLDAKHCGLKTGLLKAVKKQIN